MSPYSLSQFSSQQSVTQPSQCFCSTNEIKSPGKNVTAVIKSVYMDTRSDMIVAVKPWGLVGQYNVVNFGIGVNI